MDHRRLPPGRDRPGPQGEAGPALSEYHRFVRVLGRKVRYEDTGQGPAVLLLHGIGHSLRNWSRTVPALVEAGLRAISIDMPGFGYSEPTPEVLDEAGTTAFLEAFLDTFYLDDVDLVGHSLGGAIAAVFALHRPQRVRRLALVAAAVGPDVSPTLRLSRCRSFGRCSGRSRCGRSSTCWRPPGTRRYSSRSCATPSAG